MHLNRYEFNPVVNQIRFFIGNTQEEIVSFCRKSNRIAMRQPSWRFCNSNQRSRSCHLVHAQVRSRLPSQFASTKNLKIREGCSASHYSAVRNNGDISVFCKAAPLYVLLWRVYINEWRSVELVGKGTRGGKRVAFSTASVPVRCKRIVHKSIDHWFRCGSSSGPGDTKPVGEQGASRRISRITRTVAWANKPAFLQGWV